MDVRREWTAINREYDRYHGTIGESIVWFEYDTEASSLDDLYDVGRQRIYQVGILVPVLWIDQREATAMPEEAGRRPTQRIHFAVSAEALQKVGLSNVSEYRPHLNDVVYYDTSFWKIDRYEIKGRTHADVIVGCSGTQIFPEDERIFDRFPIIPG